ncbi:hypothetical protein [Heliophilum fasciatum]|uniref:Uncharacterized protein n=1 Tax=Heliophilum fasciatum TaxID=35700 RepID=A0A4R2RYH9_9FIRM|nr:hypothetical protein [Heliophilum fasciatum]MCW2277236.1 hypothetical protein [Heliophilum fasciatum]TCP68129.1 hypothetical protein EDD73_10431 [Heliophilum fasciatum]
MITTKLRHKIIAQKIIAMISILMVSSFFSLPLIANAVEPVQPEEPDAYVVYQRGSWKADHLRFGNDDQTRLVIRYQGNREIETAPNRDANQEFLHFDIKETTLLRTICLPFTYPADDPRIRRVNFYIHDSEGNIYGMGKTTPADPGIKDQPFDQIFKDHFFSAESAIVLPPGTYSLRTDDDAQWVRNRETDFQGAVLITGIDYAAWQKYKAKMLQQADLATGDRPQPARTPIDSPLPLYLEGSKSLARWRENPEKYQAPAESSASPQPATISLASSTFINEIVFNTYNDGKGAAPGVISIIDVQDQLAGRFQAYGARLGTVVNGMWIAGPGVVLPAGEYRLIASNMPVVACNEKGVPDFYITMAPLTPQPTDFTGRYKLNLDRQFGGAVTGESSEPSGNELSSNEPSSNRPSDLNLRDQEMVILDRGDTIELVGKYQDTTYSQVCEVTERQSNGLRGNVKITLDLMNLPGQPKLEITGYILLQKLPGLPAQMNLQGLATYRQESSPGSQTTAASLRQFPVKAGGSLYTQDLPAYVLEVPEVKTVFDDQPKRWVLITGMVLFTFLLGGSAYLLKKRIPPIVQQPVIGVEPVSSMINSSIINSSEVKSNIDQWSKALAIQTLFASDEMRTPQIPVSKVIANKGQDHVPGGVGSTGSAGNTWASIVGKAIFIGALPGGKKHTLTLVEAFDDMKKALHAEISLGAHDDSLGAHDDPGKGGRSW